MTKLPVKMCQKVEGIKYRAWFRNEKEVHSIKILTQCFSDIMVTENEGE